MCFKDRARVIIQAADNLGVIGYKFNHLQRFELLEERLQLLGLLPQVIIGKQRFQ